MTEPEFCTRSDCPGEGAASFDDDGYCEECLHHRDEPEAEPEPTLEYEPIPLGTRFIDPIPPESQRRCRNHHPVGRTSGGGSGPLKGHCGECGEPFDYANHLVEGDLVDRHYEVKGCIAHGGFGGVYLAHDRNLDTEVILKGLNNPSDPHAAALVESERRYLVAVKHPNIVEIHNSVKHRFPDGSEYDYLVMDYVRGHSLGHPYHPDRDRRSGRFAPIKAVEHTLQILDAFEYLHEFGLVYCDLKPDNVIEYEDHLVIIDLGAVRRIDHDQSPVYGSTGYQASEIERGADPDVLSDLYTVGRTLAVLALGFRSTGKTGEGPRQNPLPKRPRGFNESLYLFIERACATDRDARFTSAADMADQLRGVLRQLRADAGIESGPAASSRFGYERGAFGSDLADDPRQVFAPPQGREAVDTLPVPLVDPADPAYLELDALERQSAVRAVEVVRSLPDTGETALARLRLAIELREDGVSDFVARAEDRLGPDWRIDWYWGMNALAGGWPTAARKCFVKVRRHLPGELAPMLALAVCAELSGDRTDTEDVSRVSKHYERVWRTDRSFPSAAFGIARTAADEDDRIAALDAVPATSSHYHAAQLALLAERVRREPDDWAVNEAGRHLDNLTGLDAAQRDLAEAELWRAALRTLTTSQGERTVLVNGVRLHRNDLAHAYEAVLRRLASRSADPLTRWALVREANRHRPRTWL